MLNQAQARRLTGAAVTPFVFQFHGETVRGFITRKKVERRQAETIVRQMTSEAETRGALLVAGLIDAIPFPSEGGRGAFLYVLEGLSQLQLAEAADLGVPEGRVMTKAVWSQLADRLDATNPALAAFWRTLGFNPEHWPRAPSVERARVKRLLKKISTKFPFRCVYIDRKGLIADFESKVDARGATWLEHEIVRVNPEAMDVTSRGSIKDEILKTQRLRLWWN